MWSVSMDAQLLLKHLESSLIPRPAGPYGCCCSPPGTHHTVRCVRCAPFAVLSKTRCSNATAVSTSDANTLQRSAGHPHLLQQMLVLAGNLAQP
jgi:hypothetical protein